MPGVPALSSQDAIRFLQQRGFRLVRSRDSHHLFRNPETGRRVAVPVHGDLPVGTVREILRQAGISRDEI